MRVVGGAVRAVRLGRAGVLPVDGSAGRGARRHTAAVPDATIAERVLRLLRVVGRPLDDDEIARHLHVSPRQTINQVCRRLEAAGRLRRRLGADSKLVNELLPPAAAQLGSVPESEVAAL